MDIKVLPPSRTIKFTQIIGPSILGEIEYFFMWENEDSYEIEATNEKSIKDNENKNIFYNWLN